jgi:hypothetical protein
MSLRNLRPLTAFAVVSLCAACADGRASPDMVDSAGAPVISEGATDSVVADSAARAPDSIASGSSVPAIPAVDTQPKASGDVRSGTSATVASADSAQAPVAQQDTTKPKPKRGLLGSRAGERHMAFRDAGSDLDSLWPVKTALPLPGSILPEKRIIAFYGNPLSKRMGILGEFEPDSMLRRLDAEVAEWNRLDPGHPAQPALHLIVMVADPHPGTSGKYRTRMDSAFIEKVYGWAQSRGALLFVDLQVGQSTLQAELPWIEKFLIRPDVHLGIDPEFAMKNGGIPGRRIGTFDASEINHAIRFLADLVTKHNLPPKILVVHRFTRGGVTNYRKIELDPRVQFVMHMDGFGAPWLKRDTYWRDIKAEPVQFTGWKQFTKTRNDNPPTPREEILRLWPVPLYIQIH